MYICCILECVHCVCPFWRVLYFHDRHAAVFWRGHRLYITATINMFVVPALLRDNAFESVYLCIPWFGCYWCIICVPSVLWYCWLGLLTCKNRLPYNLYCVGGDVKHCSLTHSLARTLIEAVHNNTAFVLVRVTLKYEQFLCTFCLFAMKTAKMRSQKNWCQ